MKIVKTKIKLKNEKSKIKKYIEVFKREKKYAFRTLDGYVINTCVYLNHRQLYMRVRLAYKYKIKYEILKSLCTKYGLLRSEGSSGRKGERENDVCRAHRVVTDGVIKKRRA